MKSRMEMISDSLIGEEITKEYWQDNETGDYGDEYRWGNLIVRTSRAMCYDTLENIDTGESASLESSEFLLVSRAYEEKSWLPDYRLQRVIAPGFVITKY